MTLLSINYKLINFLFIANTYNILIIIFVDIVGIIEKPIFEIFKYLYCTFYCCLVLGMIF